ncbi:hypothetical protein ES703_41540 [subsurface metagenome]
MMTRMALALILIAAIATIGCSGGDTEVTDGTDGTDGTEVILHPTWITPQLEGDTVSIPKSEVDSGKMLHFEVPYQDASMDFMAYKLGEEIYVRSTACPPCQSVGFDLQGDILVCKGCGTLFEAETGEGISGAGTCRDYPKAEAPYTISGEKVTMGMDDLVTAYEETKEPICPTCD